MNPNNATGLVLEIQRMSTEDGPGLRTTVFFKGCSLACTWCHNPESISPHPQIHWIGSRCIGCLTCIESCPKEVLALTSKGICIDRSLCDGCGLCAQECPSTAMELMGETWKLDDLVQEVIKDKVYFEKSGGGITVSGGEPTMQATFVAEFLKRLRERGIQTALDTCGFCSQKALDKLLPHANLILFDLKEMDAGKHKRFTANSNRKILENLIHVSQYLNTHLFPESLWIRTPLIPNTTDTKENIKGIGQWIAHHLGDQVKRWELCCFNNLCKDKYKRLGLTWAFQHQALLDEHHIMELVSIARASGVDPDIVHWSGSTQLEKETTDNEQKICFH